mmetsp:Transcript_49354/g.117426  ORF Transcript_49354/g.117426 Transcript_49354/m.117426 type:complete len:233 (+) Transcript_49354:914-1612(+)
MLQQRQWRPLLDCCHPSLGIQSSDVERHNARQKFEQNHSNAVDITLHSEGTSELVGMPHLRCHCAGCATYLVALDLEVDVRLHLVLRLLPARDDHGAHGVGSVGSCRAPCGGKHLRESQVNDHGMWVGPGISRVQEHDVLRLEIFMHQTSSMTICDRLHHLLHDCRRPLLSDVLTAFAVLAHNLLQVSASCTLHHEVDVCIILVILKELDDVRVVQLSQVLNFSLQFLWRHH